MNYVNNILNKIINNNCDFCCLCFNTIAGEPVRFGDEVGLLENDLKNNAIVGEIISYLFGQEMLRDISAFDALCQQCVISARNSYKFIKDCKQNTQYLFNVVEHLANCFENTPQDLQDTKTLFVSLNPDLCTSNQYYDNIGFVATCSNAFERFESIANLNLPKVEDIKLLKKVKKEFRVKSTFPKLSRNNNDTDSDGKSESEEKLFDKNELKCKECSKIFTNIVNLRNHFVRVHGLKAIKCPECRKCFPSESMLRAHKEAQHATLVCTECGKTFNNRHTLKMHEKGHYLRLVCQDCGRVYKNHNTFKKHIDNNICQTQTRHSQADAKFTCDYCQKKYSQKITLRVHMQYEHLNYKALECKWCDKKFWCKSRLNAHVVKHTKERNFVCVTCNGKFVTKESLLYHTRIHTGERPYPCPHCDSRFLSASRRQAHVKTHHMDPTVECDICHSKFRSHHYLQKHKKIHSVPEIDSEITEINSNSKEPEVESSHINKFEGSKLKRKTELPTYRRFNSKSKGEVQNQSNLLEFEVDPVSKRNVKYYYEIDAEGNLKLHSNPEILQIESEAKVGLPDASSRIEVIYEANEDNQEVQQVVDNNFYLEVVSDEDDYVIKVSENVEV